MNPNPPQPPTTRVFLVDDQATVRRGLQLLLKGVPNLEVCGEAATAAEALKWILVEKPDLVILDLNLGEKRAGLELIRELRQYCPGVKPLVFSMCDDLDLARAAFKSGAKGYVAKDEGSEKLVDAIHRLVAGRSYLTAAIAAKMIQSRHRSWLRP